MKDASTSYEQYSFEVKSSFCPAFSIFVRAKALAGELKPFTNSTGYDIPNIDYWNAIATQNEFFKNNEEDCWRFMDKWSSKFASYMILFALPNNTEESTSEQRYAHLIVEVNAGNFSWFVGAESAFCRKSGLNLNTEYANWQPVLGTIDHSDHNSPFIPAPPRSRENKVLHTTVTFPTKSGQVLLPNRPERAAFT